MTEQQIYGTISALAHSQGFYGRLKSALDNADAGKRTRFYASLAKCVDEVDLILALEG